MGDSTVTLVRADPSQPRAVLDVDVDEMHSDVGVDEFQRPSAAPPAPVRRRPPPPARHIVRAPPRAPSPPPPQPRLEEVRDFANPGKVLDDTESFDDDDLGGDNNANEDEFQQHQQDHHHDDDDDEYQDYEQQQQLGREPPVEPMPPFKTIEEERADLNYKLSRTARLTNIPVKNFPYNVDIRELRAEVGRIKAEQDVTASVSFQRQLLMTICSGLEFANRKFAVMDLELDGWSESVLEDIGKYDRIFEKLHTKHARMMNIPPEVELIMMIGGSAVTWHLTHTLMTRASGGSSGKKKRRRHESSSDDDDEEYERERERRRRKSKKKKQQRRRVSDDDDDDDDDQDDQDVARRYARVNGFSGRAPPQSQPRQRREMRGPGFDIGSLMGLSGMPGLSGGLPAGLMPQMTREPQAPPAAPPTVTEIPSPRPRQQVSQSPLDESPYMNDRLSDIASEDLPMIPDDLDEASQSQSQLPEDTRVVDVPTAKKRGGGGRKKADSGPAKKVVVI